MISIGSRLLSAALCIFGLAALAAEVAGMLDGTRQLTGWGAVICVGASYGAYVFGRFAFSRRGRASTTGIE